MAYRYGSPEPGFQRQSRVDPRRVPRQLWTDPDFDPREAMYGQVQAVIRKMEWKRPHEITRTPHLFTDGTSRYDVGQGGVGTCWFLAAVSTIADDSTLLNKVIPPESYSLDTPDYNGTFHARFWQFGVWEDVYIDDLLPVIKGKLWGARSATDKNEMWISLLEKAFAKHHGSYEAVDGGFAGDAYVELTGGVAETVRHTDITDRKQFYARIHNAISSGCQVISAVPEEFDGVQGLVGGHAYSMSGTAKVREERLLRLRNPWGKGEWTGRWSDGSSAWQGIPASKIPHADRDDGEFWISYDDFMSYFSRSAICAIKPDFDQDGHPVSLDYVQKIYGQWTGSTAATNPKYSFTLTNHLEPKPLVVQIIQKKEGQRDQRDLIRCDLFKVQGGTMARVMEYMGINTSNYQRASQRCFRFRLGAGTYCLKPMTRDPGIKRKFLIRVFSSTPLSNVRFVSWMDG